MFDGRNYIKEARIKLEAGDVNSTFLIIADGLKAGDKKSMMVAYYMPKPENITWHEKCKYLEKNFFQFDLDMSFDDFQSEVGPVGRWELFKQCASDLFTNTDNLKTKDYYDWCLEHKFKIPRKACVYAGSPTPRRRRH